MKKIVLLAFVFLLLSTAVIIGFVRPAVAQGTIYIRANGLVEGTDKIVSVDNVTYTFTDNIYDEIQIERNNTVLDGADYTVQGTQAFPSKGINLSGRSNVTIKNMTIKAFYCGIYLDSSSNNIISGNNITNNNFGIYLYPSSDSIISGNNITNNDFGIYLWHSSGSIISGNNITNDKYCGISLLYSSNNFVYHNNFINNTEQAYSSESTNTWDDDAGKGNYWSDYEERYLNATEIDGLGIWDTPYVIDENNQDNYPIVPEFPTWTSMLLLLVMLTAAIAFYKRRLLKTTIC